MKFQKIFLFVLLISSLSYGAEEFPKLFLEYGFPFDLMCSQTSKPPITQEMEEELSQRLPEFQKAWDGCRRRKISLDGALESGVRPAHQTA